MVITAVTVTTVKITVYQYFYLLLLQLLLVPYSGCDRNGAKSMITINTGLNNTGRRTRKTVAPPGARQGH
mgnify:CR=1 FL=1